MLHLNVITPEKAFLADSCLSVTLPGKLGQFMILPGHTPCLIELTAGLISYEDEKKKTVRFMIAHGFLQIDKDQVNVLCEQAQLKDEIDQEEEKEKLFKLKERILKISDEEELEQKKLVADLEKCVARLSLFE